MTIEVKKLVRSMLVLMAGMLFNFIALSGYISDQYSIWLLIPSIIITLMGVYLSVTSCLKIKNSKD